MRTRSSFVAKSRPKRSCLGKAARSTIGLLRQDLDLILATVPTVKTAIPIREIRRQFTYRDRVVDGRLVGCTPGYADVNSLVIRNRGGRFLTDADGVRSDTVCVVSAGVAERLFPFEEPLGKRIYIPESKDYYQNRRSPRATQSRRPRSEARWIPKTFSSDIYVPIQTIRKRIGDTIVDPSERPVPNRDHGTEPNHAPGRCR